MDKENLTYLTEKIYEITLLFPKKEPLRYKLREIATEILEKIFSSKISKNPVIDDLEVLNSFLEIAKKQNWVSPKEIEKIQKNYENLKREIVEKFSQKKLNSRQEKILEILKEKGKIQVGKLKEYFPSVSKRTLRRDLKKLVSLGHVLRKGEISNTFYQLKEQV